MRKTFRLLTTMVASVGILCMASLSTQAFAETKPKADTSEAKLRRMIGQMVMVGFTGDSPSDQGFEKVLEQAKAGEITGVIYLKRNIKSEKAVRDLNARLQDAGGGRMLIAIDQEGGRIQRLTSDVGFKNTPGAAKIAGSMNEAAAYEIYSALASELSGLGFNVNFGPVVDLNINPSNPIIGRIGRSYSADPQEVIKYATAFVQGHRVNNVLTALKHFPGHGSSVGDSHKGTADVTKTWREAELIPYQQLIGMGDVDMVMSSHVVNRTLAGGNVPASLSRQTLTGLLKHDLQFGGVVITDDMQMDAIRANYSLEDTILKAVYAGNDILVFANDKHPDPLLPEKIARILVAEAEKDPKMLNRIQDAYRRVSQLKKKIAGSGAGVDPVKTKSIPTREVTILTGEKLLSYLPRKPLSLSE